MAGTSVAFQLHRMIGERFGWRGEFQVTESLCMLRRRPRGEGGPGEAINAAARRRAWPPLRAAAASW